MSAPAQSTNWTYPFYTNQGDGSPYGNIVTFTVGTPQTLKWSTNLSTYALALYQQTPDNGGVQALVLQNFLKGSGDQTFPWNVSIGTSNRTSSQTYFFWVNPSTNYEGTSSYFNITYPNGASSSSASTAPSSTSMVSSSPSPSAINATSPSSPSSASGTPTPSSTSSSLKVGLGVGIGVGIPALLLIAALLWFVLVKRPRRGATRPSDDPRPDGKSKPYTNQPSEAFKETSSPPPSYMPHEMSTGPGVQEVVGNQAGRW